MRQFSKCHLTMQILALGALVLAGQSASAGWVYTSTNQASGNRVRVFLQTPGGLLIPFGSVPTGGNGTGTGLGNQGAVTLSENGKWLLVTNAGSDNVTAFRAIGPLLFRTDVESSNGDQPISVTIHDRTVYVLNALTDGGAGNISGMRLNHHGRLVPIADSSRPLSGAAMTAPAQVQFDPPGDTLVVTEKDTNIIDTYQVDADGVASATPNAQPSAGETPFGFGFTSTGTLIVSEAFDGMPDASALSSYTITDATGDLTIVTPSAPTTETAACWIAITGDDAYAYTTNTGSGSVTGYAIAPDGTLTALDADGVTGDTGDGSMPIDAAVTKFDRFLIVLASGTNQLMSFRINDDGSLTQRDTAGGLPPGSTGLAVR